MDRNALLNKLIDEKFILEGIATVVIGGISYWFIVDFPDDANFLNPLEKHALMTRLKADGQTSYRTENFQWQSVLDSFKDWKTYMGMFINMGCAGSIYAFALFLPSIINELGYSANRAQLLTVPPYAVACVMVIMCSLS